jgi:fructosamine-3-kinase
VSRTFVKKVPREQAARLDAEVDGLAALRATGAIRVPRVIARGADAAHAWLELEWLDLVPPDDGAALGRALAALHRAPVPQPADATSSTGAAHADTTRRGDHSGADPDFQGTGRFGWHRANFIGATPQANAWHDHWPVFWRDCRLAPQLELAGRNGHGGALQRDGERLLAATDVLLHGHAPVPSLLHGDLWGGNAGLLRDGTPVIFDPVVYAGDRECDLAMTELFGGFDPHFHAAYREAWPLPDGYEVRRELYNL